MIGDWDFGILGSGLGIWDWDWGLGIRIEDWDWGLELGIGDWGLGLGIGIGDWDGVLSKDSFSLSSALGGAAKWEWLAKSNSQLASLLPDYF